MSWIPSYKLYAQDGITLVYTFDAILDDNSPQDPKKGYEVENIRGQGSIHISGSEASWDLSLRFHLSGTNYEDVIAKMDTLKNTILMDTNYVLKIDRTSSTTQNYNVMLKQSIAWDSGKRVRYQQGSITFRIHAW